MILRFKGAKMDTHEIVYDALKELRAQVLAEMPCRCWFVNKGRTRIDPGCKRHTIAKVMDEYIRNQLQGNPK